MDIFMGWNPRASEAADVLALSILDQASIPVRIHYLKHAVLAREHGYRRVPDPFAASELACARFLVPYLTGYRGKALYMDNDMLCLSDVAELDALDMAPYALRVVKNDPRHGDRTSLMLMDCAKLTLWSKPFVEQATESALRQFQGIPRALIGDIPSEWHHLDRMDGTTKLVHWTNGGPWFEDSRDCPHADVWLRARDRWASIRHAGGDRGTTWVG